MCDFTSHTCFIFRNEMTPSLGFEVQWNGYVELNIHDHGTDTQHTFILRLGQPRRLAVMECLGRMQFDNFSRYSFRWCEAEEGIKMTLTVTKADLLKLLKDIPNDAKIYVMATIPSVQKAIETANRTEEKDVFPRIAATNIIPEENGVSLIAYAD